MNHVTSHRELTMKAPSLLITALLLSLLALGTSYSAYSPARRVRRRTLPVASDAQMRLHMKKGDKVRTGVSKGTEKGKVNVPVPSVEEIPKPVEPKYAAAGAVFLLACLYDFFITHQGFKDGWVP